MKVVLLLAMLLLLGPVVLAAASNRAEGPGLAAKYPLDRGIERDPDVIFFEDFEDANWRNKWYRENVRWRVGKAVERVVDSKAAFQGSAACKLPLAAARKYGASLGSGKLKPGWKTMHMRWYVWFSPNYVGGKHGTITALDEKTWVPGAAGKRPTGTDKANAMACINQKNKQVSMYYYHLDQRGRYGSGGKQNVGAPVAVKNGLWHCIEVAAGMNDPGEKNGWQRLWIDGRLKGEWNGLRWRSAESLMWNSWCFLIGTNNDAGEAQYLLLDNIVVSSRYIGPIANPAVARPRSGRSPRRASGTGTGGIAAQYPHDRGIEGHPSVIFASDFENEFRGWTRWKKGGIHEIVADGAIAHSSGKCLRATATRGKDTGGDCVFKLPKAVDKIHLRFYCKFHTDTVIPHHFVKLRAHAPTARLGGNAGKRPKGDWAFWTGIEPIKKHTWHFYTYWHQMRSWNNPDGTPKGGPEGNGRSFYGNSFNPDDQKPFKMNQWICVEAMMKANTPGQSDGELAFWIDGKKIGHWKPGSPVGSWIRDRFVTSGPYNKVKKPFKGFDFRTSADVMFHEIALQWYVSARTAKDAKVDRNICYFDDVVVATEYIGPRVEQRVARKSNGSRPSSLRVWPAGSLAAQREAAQREAAQRAAVGAAERLTRQSKWSQAVAAYKRIRGELNGEAAAGIELRLKGIGARAKLVDMIVQRFADQGPKGVYIDFAGSAQRARLVAADKAEGTFQMKGSRLPMAWDSLAPRRLAGIAAKYAFRGADHLAISTLLLACGESDSVRAALDKALAANLSDAQKQTARRIGAALKGQ